MSKTETEMEDLILIDGGHIYTNTITSNQITATEWIESKKFRTASSGARIEFDSTSLRGYNSAGTLQAYLSAADGKIYGAGGSIILDQNYLQVRGQKLQISHSDGSHNSWIYSDASGNLQIAPYGNINMGGVVHNSYGHTVGSCIAKSTNAIIVDTASPHAILRPSADATCYLGTASYHYLGIFGTVIPCFSHKFPEGHRMLSKIKKIKATKEGKWDAKTMPKEMTCTVELENGKKIKSPDIYSVSSALTRAIQELTERIEKLEKKVK